MLRQVLSHPWVYHLWQSPFFREKMGPVIVHGDLEHVRRVLEVGCGPGTNAQFFAHCDFYGIDINSAYIDHARRRCRGTFDVVDVREYRPRDDERYDLILINSLLHHLSDAETDDILASLARLLSPGGHVHVVELVLPPKPSVARWLARHDRGDYPRTPESWQTLIGRRLDIVHFEPFALRRCGIALWELFYCKAAAPAPQPISP